MSDSIINALITSYFLPADIKEVIVVIEEKKLNQHIEIYNLPREKS